MPVTLGVEDTSIRTAIAKLVPIWEEVLNRRPIGEDENFFAVGGNPSLAVKLFDEVSKVFGLELPPLAIYHAQTIGALAALIERHIPHKFSPLIPLKPGNDKAPVFLAPGLGGSVLEFFGLMKNIETPSAAFGLQGIAENGADLEFERIEDMAEFYAEAIKQLQACGPYRIIGYSLGGLVALEIARRLSQMGQQIALLVMLDAYPHQRALPFGQWTRHVARLSAFHAAMLKRLPARSALRYLISSSERMRHVPKGDAEKFIRVPYLLQMHAARDQAYLALKRYRPQPYDGRVQFVAAAEASIFPVDATAVWAPWLRNLQVATVPGNHYDLVRKHSEQVGQLLSRYLREVG